MPDHDKSQNPDRPPSPEGANHGSSAAGFLAGVAVGALLGAGVAWFLGSGGGRRVGRRIRAEWEDFRDEAGRELARRRKELRRSAGRAAHQAGELVEEALEGD